MNDQSQTLNQSHMMNRNYGIWPPVPGPPPPQPLDDSLMFKSQSRPGFMTAKPGGRSNWKGKKGGDKRKENRRMDMGSMSAMGGAIGSGGSGGGYQPPTLHELQSQNRMKARRFYPKKKFNNRFAPFAPRNTTSFIIRAKKSGGIASLVSPCPVTPAVLPTPMFSPSREVLVDMAKEEWGVDGYGSMNGLIRLRSPGNEGRDDEYEEEGGGSSESDVEEHVEVERRLDHDLSRFEMIYPNFADEHGNQVDEQDTHIAQLEEENLTLKERLFLMERELVDMRMRLQCLETESRSRKENNDGTLQIESSSNKEVNIDEMMEDGEKGGNNNAFLENEGVGGNEEDNHDDTVENVGGSEKEGNNDDEASENEGGGDICSEKSIGDDD